MQRMDRGPYYLVNRRLVAIIALAIATYFILKIFSVDSTFPPTNLLYFYAVTVISAILIVRTFKEHNMSIIKYLGFERKTLVKDILWALLIVIISYIPMVASLMGMMYLFYGVNMFDSFELVFVPQELQIPAIILVVVAILQAVTFIFNAPIEEIIFRGWLQQGLTIKHGAYFAIIIQSILFGFQHAFFGYNFEGMIIFFVMFFFWGLTAGIVVQIQKRLASITIAHFIINFFTGVVPPILIIFLI